MVGGLDGNGLHMLCVNACFNEPCVAKAYDECCVHEDKYAANVHLCMYGGMDGKYEWVGGSGTAVRRK